MIQTARSFSCPKGPPIQVRVVRAVVEGWLRASMAAELLVHESCWFECTPLPDDQYEFVAKDEPGPKNVLEQFERKPSNGRKG